jgi:hypothetical protein
MSAPEDGARVSGTHGPVDAVTGAAVGRDCGLNVDLYVDAFTGPTPPAGSDEECRAACVVGAVVAGFVSGACDVVWTVEGVVAGNENGKVGRTVTVRCTLSGWMELADAVDGANVAETATSAATAPPHAASEAIGASRRPPRARRLGRAERMRRDTGRDSGSDGDRGGDRYLYGLFRVRATCTSYLYELAYVTRTAYAYGEGKRISGGSAGLGGGGSMPAALRPSATAAMMPDSSPVRWSCQEMCIVVTSAEG